jgi:membrane protease YdiL (CAAX protease family)
VFVRSLDGRVRAGWRFILFLSALTAAGLLVSGLRHVLDLPRLRDANGIVVPAALLTRGLLVLGSTLAVTAALLRVVEKRPLATVGLPLRRPWLSGIAVGLLLGAAPVVLLVAGLAATGHARFTWSGLGAADVAWRWGPTVVGLALTSAAEELTLRGYGLQLLSEGGGQWFAAIVTGAAFGAIHAANPGANVLGIVNTAVNAILLAWLVMRTGSLWIGCAYHAGWNIAGAPVLGMRLSGMDHTAGLLATRLSGPDWLTGGSYGFEGSLILGFVELVVLAAAVALARRLSGHPDLRVYFGDRRTRAERGGSWLLSEDRR